ncbi:MAG: lysylphosphatidylglycerol synthase domain-containing protein, partial [Chitinophagales bacterium]
MHPPPDDKHNVQELMTDNPKLQRQFGYRKIILVILIGLLLSGFLIVSSFDIEAFTHISWNSRSLLWIFFGYLMLITRHLAFMYRLRLITNNVVSFRSSFSVITLWLFASAVTPSTVGGAAAAVYFLKKEKLSIGKSATTSLLTVFLDQAVFAILAPIATLLIGSTAMFATDVVCRNSSELPLMHVFHSLQSIYWTAYIFYLLIVLLLAYGLFFNAQSISRFIQRIFAWRILRRWHNDAVQTGKDIVETSKELKGKDLQFWVKACASTVVAWFALFTIS